MFPGNNTTVYFDADKVWKTPGLTIANGMATPSTGCASWTTGFAYSDAGDNFMLEMTIPDNTSQNVMLGVFPRNETSMVTNLQTTKRVLFVRIPCVHEQFVRIFRHG